jgi:hypothetical protein
VKHTTSFYIGLLIAVGLYSCKSSSTDFATKWTNDIKQKIIADAGHQPDSSTFDSANYRLTLYEGNTKLKHFMLRPKFDTVTGKINSVDTIASIFYSTDQNFQLVRELCPVVDRSFEGVKYNKIGSVGLTEFRFCDGKIKERGFRYGFKHFGIWTTYDSTGKIIEETDNGNMELLEKLHDIKYYR